MLPKKLPLVFAAAAVLAATACNVKNVEVHGAYEGAGLRESAHPVMTEMFNLAFKTVKLPAGSVSSAEYVAVYRLSSGKAEDRWWCYLAEDWLVDKIRAAGATPVERNDLAKRLLAAEGEYLEPPPPAGIGAPTAPTAYGRRADVALTPYRATRALAYRVVAADLWFDHFSSHHGRQEPTVRANANVIVNLRTVDVKTGEVLWSGSASATARKTFPVSRLMGWMGIYDWEDCDDWDDSPGWWWWWRWDGDDDSIAEPAPGEEPGDEPDLSEEEPLEDDESAEEPAPADSYSWPW